jgi:hypothetical protein
MVVKVRKPLKNKIGEVIESIGTIYHIFGSDVHVLLSNGDIWSGTVSEVALHVAMPIEQV